MKEKTVWRIAGIGFFHTVLYLYVVPFIVYPAFGRTGLLVTVALSLGISLVVLGTLFKQKTDKRS